MRTFQSAAQLLTLLNGEDRIVFRRLERDAQFGKALIQILIAFRHDILLPPSRPVGPSYPIPGAWKTRTCPQ